MPQFDIFSFYSQLFWVFSSFFLLYLTICFCILPSIATTLKIRNRKLKQMIGSTDNNSLEINNQGKNFVGADFSIVSNA